MINRKASAFILGLFLVIYSGSAAMAADTEIYDGSGTQLSAPPLVMFQVDLQPSVLNASFNCTADICSTLIANGFLDSATTTNFGILIAALKYVLNDLGDVKIGLMVSHKEQNGQACVGREDSGCSGGGYIMMGFTEISTDPWNSDTGKSAFFEKLNNLKDWSEGNLTATDDSNGNAKVHLFQGKEVFFEFFRYLTGHNAFSSHLGWADYGTSSTNNLNHSDDYEVFMRDLDIEGISLSGSPSNQDTQYATPGVYTSPLTEDCQKVFTINFLKGGLPQVEDDADSEIVNGTDPANGSTGGGNGSKAHGAMENIALSGNNNKLETVLEYLNGTDFADGTWGVDDDHRAPDLMGSQHVTNYFIVSSSGLQTGHRWAQAGGTPAAIEWADNDTGDIVSQIESIFLQILSTSTTFTAASVPVSVLNRAQIVDNVFIALFKSDPDGFETWPGNVKRLRLDTTDGYLVDAQNNSAINPNDGRINNSALTFWTDDSTLPTADPDNDEIDGKDGRSVKRGGAGQIIPGFRTSTIGSSNSDSGARQLFYEPGTADTALSGTPLNIDDTTATALQTDLGAADLDEAKVLLRYIRGFDVSTDTTNETTTREWIMGDPLHSRPLPINYGNSTDADKPDIRLVFGSNDGFFRMVQNTIDNPTLDASDDIYGVDALGEENWAFMPREVMGIVKKLKTNDGSNEHPYGVDGPPSALVIDANNDGVIDSNTTGDKAQVFFGLRRGGRAMYSLDITDPDAPEFNWSISSSDSGFSELGYTFSQPRVGYMNWGSGKEEVVIFAGGYDLDKDDQIPHDGTDDNMGNAFYIVDADSGALIWKVAHGTTGSVSATEYNHASMDDSIPSTVSAVDTDGDGMIDRAYVGDTGGRVWRFDMVGTDRTAWKATVIASVGYRDSTTTGNDRRFFHRPDFIQFKDGNGDYDAVVIASGNRAHPKKDMDNDDYLYVIKDRNTTGVSTVTDPLNHSDADEFYDVTDNCLQDADVTCADDDATISAKLANGWKLKFEEDGEKSLATPTTLAKKIFVTTYLPEGGAASGSCAPKEGAGRLYALNLADGTAVNDYDVTNGDVLEKTDRYTELDSGGIPAEVVYVPFNRILKPDLSIENVGVSGRWKTYWYKKEN